MTRPLVAAVLLLASAAIPARAQSIDHNAFEQMFGEPVTSSATGQPQRASEVPVEMDIVTADDIRRSGADNIPDVLRFVAGLDVRQYGMQDASVGIRGYNTALNPRVLVLLDGRQVYQDDYGLTVWPVIPVALSAIRQIEIIKGPSSALYGFDAVSGVINIVTFDPLVDPVNAARAQGGTQSQAYGEAVATAQIPDRAGVRLSATGFRSTEFLGNQENNTRQQPHSGTVAADARLKIVPNVEWDLSASMGSLDGDYYVDLGYYTPIAYKANSLRSRITADTDYGVLQIDAYRNENRSADYEQPQSDRWREDVAVVQASDLLKLGHDHIFRVAAEYRDNSASSRTAFSGRLGYSDVAGSMMWDWQLLRCLSLTNAIRLDDLSLRHQGAQFDIPGAGGLYRSVDIVEPSFNSGAVLKLTSYDVIRITAARAVQLPSLLDFGLSTNVGDVILAGDPSLRPSVVQNYELDYDRQLPSLGSTLRMAAFAQRTSTSIGSPFGSGSSFLPTGQLLLQAKNFGDSREFGGEIGLKGSSASGLRWAASYAVAAVHDDTTQASFVAAPSVNYQRQTPTHSVILEAGYSWRHLDFDMQARWQSHFQDYEFDLSALSARPVTIPNYITVNTRLAYRVASGVTLSLLAEQLNQQNLTETAGLQVDRRLVAGIEAKF